MLHGSWLGALWLLVPPDAPVIWPLLVLFALLQAARVWVIGSLGRYWTTRIITVPGAPLVRRGPYRWLEAPNYVVVAAEIAVLPLAFGAWQIALLFSVLNALLLYRPNPRRGSGARSAPGIFELMLKSTQRRAIACSAASRISASGSLSTPFRTARASSPSLPERLRWRPGAPAGPRRP